MYCLNNPIALHDPDGKEHKNKTAPAKKEKTPEPQKQPELNSVLHMQSNLVASDQPTPGGSPRGNNIGSSHRNGTSLVEHAKSLIPRGFNSEEAKYFLIGVLNAALSDEAFGIGLVEPENYPQGYENAYAQGQLVGHGLALKTAESNITSGGMTALVTSETGVGVFVGSGQALWGVSQAVFAERGMVKATRYLNEHSDSSGSSEGSSSSKPESPQEQNGDKTPGFISAKSGGAKPSVVAKAVEKIIGANPAKAESILNGCEAVAKKLQKVMGGEFLEITPQRGFLFLGKVEYAGQTAPGWYHHVAVIKEGKVYDKMTGANGLALKDYMAMFKDHPIFTVNKTITIK